MIERTLAEVVAAAGPWFVSITVVVLVALLVVYACTEFWR